MVHQGFDSALCFSELSRQPTCDPFGWSPKSFLRRFIVMTEKVLSDDRQTLGRVQKRCAKSENKIPH
jgi:hypothetical protein